LGEKCLTTWFSRLYLDCYFTKKAWNAQNAGAATILMVDDEDEPLITVDTHPLRNPGG
jgi:hypothetical protein